MSKLVFDFVKSLSPREKAHFNRYTRLYSDNQDKNYLKIYRYFGEREEYNEVALKAYFEGETFVKYLSSEAHYLLEQLLNSLINFHGNTSIYYKLLKLIFYINLLKEKGFRKKAAKILQKAQTLAMKYEEFTIIIELIRLEEEMLFSHGILNFVEKLELLKQKREVMLGNMQTLNDIWLLKAQIWNLQFEFQEHVSDLAKYEHILNHPILESIDRVKSKKGREVWYYIKGIICFLKNDFAQYHRWLILYLDFFEQHEYLFAKDRKPPIISNYMYMSAKLRDTHHFNIGLQKLNNLTEDKDLDVYYINYIKYSRLFELHYKTGNNTVAEALVLECRDFLNVHLSELGTAEQDYLLRLVIRVKIVSRQFEKAQEWINFWYERAKNKVGIKVIKLFSMITYLELEYFSLLEYEVRSSKIVFGKRSKCTGLELSLIRFFKRVSSNASHTKMNRAVDALITDLSGLKKTSVQDFRHEFFDFLEWIKFYKSRL